jgi:Flp pilus assembly protein TadB
MVIAEIQEPLAGELGAIVRDDAVGNPEAMDDVGEEQRGLL